MINETLAAIMSLTMAATPILPVMPLNYTHGAVKVVGLAIEEVETVLQVEDRTKPRYEVYKNGYPVSAATAELQWMVYDISQKYDIDEKLLFGCIVAESTFNPQCAGDGGTSYGLFQIKAGWLTANIGRLEDETAPSERNLLDPHDNLVTLVELWQYAIAQYDIDITTEQGQKDLLYWHNTGRYIKNVSWNYSNKIMGFKQELVELPTEYIDIDIVTPLQ